MGGSGGGWCTRPQGAFQQNSGSWMEWMCSYGLHLNFIEVLWGEMKVELGQIWGRVDGPEAWKQQ